MPKYNYRCSACCEEFEVYHSMTEKLEECTLCENGTIERIPFLSFSVLKANKAGSLVKKFIEDTRKDIEVEKEKLKEEHSG